jgi:short-subunit dehydrogenase
MTGLVWITGASTGIGRAVALIYARRGQPVAASARGADQLADLVAEAGSAGHLIHPFPLDVTDRAATAEVVARIEAAHGPITLAILNAGTHQPSPAATFDAAIYDRLFQVNVFGVVNGMAAVLPRLVERRAGHLAIVSSVAGYGGLPSASAYGATKAALINLAEAIKPELERHSVDVSVVNPGFVKTPLTDLNDFPMPFLMPVDKAAAAMVRGLDQRRFEVTFPRRFTTILKFLRLLPYGAYFWIVRRTAMK